MQYLRNLKMKFNYPTYLILVLLAALTLPGCGERDSRGSSALSRVELKERIQEKLDIGYEQYREGDFVDSERTFRELESDVRDCGDPLLKIKFLIGSSELAKNQGAYAQSLENYFEAAKLAEQIKDTFYLGLSHYNISAIYTLQKNFELAEQYCHSSTAYYSAIKDEAKMANCKVLLSILVREELPDSARNLLKEAFTHYEHVGDRKNQAICYNTLGNISSDQEEYEEAIRYYQKAIEISSETNLVFSRAIQLGNLGEVYMELEEWEKGKLHVDSSLKYALEVDSREIIYSDYERLQVYFQNRGILDSALHYADLKLAEKIEIMGTESAKQAEKQQVAFQNELDLARAQNEIQVLELKEQQQRESNLLTWFIGGLVLLLLLLGTLALYSLFRKERRVRAVEGKLLRNELDRVKAEQETAQMKLEKEEAESRRLEEALDYKRRTLLSMSLSMRERENLDKEIREVLKAIRKSGGLTENIEQKIQHLAITVGKDEHQELFAEIESLNESFTAKLQGRFPKLSKDDLRLSSLVVLGMSSKEISHLLHIEAKSVDMKKYRLKKKLALAKEEDLKSFLHNV